MVIVTQLKPISEGEGKMVATLCLTSHPISIPTTLFGQRFIRKSLLTALVRNAVNELNQEGIILKETEYLVAY